MNRVIPNGSWCLFQLNPQGSRNGKVVLAQHRDIADPETGGSFTVKVYRSTKVKGEDGWRHDRIELRPNSDDPRFLPIVLTPAASVDVSIVAELIEVL